MFHSGRLIHSCELTAHPIANARGCIECHESRMHVTNDARVLVVRFMMLNRHHVTAAAYYYPWDQSVHVVNGTKFEHPRHPPRSAHGGSQGQGCCWCCCPNSRVRPSTMKQHTINKTRPMSDRAQIVSWHLYNLVFFFFLRTPLPAESFRRCRVPSFPPHGQLSVQFPSCGPHCS